MTDTCWAYGNTIDCVWVVFGYGSRWDMLGETYRKGFLLGLEGLKTFLYYDFPLGEYLFISPHKPNWIEECKKVAGGFLRDYPDYKEHYPNIITQDEEPFYHVIPSLEKGIPSINKKDADAINRVFEINNTMLDHDDTVLTWLGPMKKEDWESARVTEEELKGMFGNLNGPLEES